MVGDFEVFEQLLGLRLNMYPPISAISVPPKASLRLKSAWFLLCTNNIKDFTFVTFRVTLAWYEKWVLLRKY